MADEVVRVLIETDADVVAVDRTTGSLVELEKQARRTDDATLTLDKTNRRLTTGMRDANRTATFLGNTLKLIKFPALIAGAGLATQGIAGLTGGVVALTGALAPLSGALVAYPALLTSIGQAALTTKIALGGVSEALGGNKEAFKDLTPEAQKFVRTLEDYKKLTGGLQASAQKGLFAGVTEGLESAVGNLDRLDTVVKSTAGSMGFLAQEAGKFLGREGFGRDFEAIGLGNARIIRQLGQAGLNLADALRHVMVEAQPLLQWMADSALKISEWISESARMNRENGDMAKFFRQTKEAIQDVVAIGTALASTFSNIARAGAPLGRDLLDSLRKGANELERWSESTSGKNSIEDYFRRARPILYETGKLVRDIGEAFFSLSTDPGVAQFIERIRRDLLPVLVELTRVTTEQFAPALIDLLIEGSELFANFVGSNGPLTVFVQALSNAAEILNDLIDLIPGLGSALSAALTGFSILKLLGLTSIGPVFTKAGATAGASFAAGMQMTAGKTFFGGSGGTGAKGSWAGNLAEGAKTLGKRFLGVSLAIGVLEGFTSEAPTITGKLQDAVSSMTLGLIPSFEESSAELAASFTKGLREGMDVTSLSDSEAVKVGAGRFAGGAAAAAGGSTSHLKALAPLLKSTATSYKNAEDATKAWRQELARTKDEFTPADYHARLKAVNELYEGFRNSKDATREFEDNVYALKNSLHHSMTDIRKDSEKNLKELARSMDLRSAEGKDAVVKNYEATEDAIKNSLNAGLISERKALKELRSILEKELRTYGIKDVGAMISRMESPQYGSGEGGKQRGGAIYAVPGRGDGDKVPAMLEPGEVVVNKTAVAEMGGPGRVNQINKILPRFAKGGTPKGGGGSTIASGLVQALGPFSIPPIVADENHGANPTGYNSHLHLSGESVAWAQTVARAIAPLGWSASEAPWAGGVTVNHSDPGHYSGSAFDANSGDESRAAVAEVAKILGGSGAVSGGGAVGAAITKALKLPRWTSDFPYGGLVAEAVNKVAAGAEDQVNAKLAERNTTSADGGSIPTDLKGPWVSVMHKIADQKNWSFGDWWKLVMGESGGDPTAVNPSSGAFGIGQFLGETLEAYAKYGAKSTDPVKQIEAMAQYISDRYNNPTTAYQTWLSRSPHWYKGGGIVAHVGDSLSVGMQDYAPDDWKINAQKNRRPSEGVGILARMVAESGNASGQVFDLGTNSPSELSSAISSLIRKSDPGDVPLTLVTGLSNGMNSAISSFDSKDGVGVADWAGYMKEHNIDHDSMGHLNGSDYRRRMRFIEQNTTRVDREAEDEVEGGPRGQGGIVGSTPWTELYTNPAAKLPPDLVKSLSTLETLIAQNQDYFSDLESAHASPRSEMGEELSPIETYAELDNLGQTLDHQTTLRTKLSRAMAILAKLPATGKAGKVRQGYADRLKLLVGPTGDYGEIGVTKDAIWNLQHPEDTTGESVLTQEKLEISERLLRSERLRSALLASQYDVIPSILRGLGMPFVGAYAEGGVIPRDGLAYVHKGETVVNQGGITINLSGDLARFVQAEVAGAARVIDKRMGERARRLTVAPGG